ncbi:hypothetical protein OIU79_019051 [Salix purpurea]|uniref:Cytochrome P450 n=1 Tax=Salix purpurea TaxID=77065 RepID=A0A9Q0P0L8_SALPP|nr:hypothetical protein OIU79_019051 [Salix purpurea]
MDPSPQFIAIALFFSCILLYNALIKKKMIKGNQIKEAPEPDGAWPIIGHLHLLGGGESLKEEGRLSSFQYDANTSIKSTCLVS